MDQWDLLEAKTVTSTTLPGLSHYSKRKSIQLRAREQNWLKVENKIQGEK